MKKTINLWVIASALLLTLILIAIFWAGMIYLRGSSPVIAAEKVSVTIIAAPTLTPVVIIPTPTVTPTQAEQFIPPPNTNITVGSYVQVVGTGGDGLRLRAEPGINGTIKFLGLDSEVFLVKDGPVDRDGFTWWNLSTPLNETRAGWAVSNYLSIANIP